MNICVCVYNESSSTECHLVRQVCSLLGDSVGRNSKEKGNKQGSVSVPESPMSPHSIFRGSGAQTADSPAT